MLIVRARDAARGPARRHLHGGRGMETLTKQAPALAVLALLATTGCASRGDVDALRAEIAGLRSSVVAADMRAANAEAEAQRAAAAAQAASEARRAEADAAYRRSLRK